MGRTTTVTHVTDLVLRRVEVIPTSVGYRLRLHCHEVDTVNGSPVESREKVYEDTAVDGALLAGIYAAIDKALLAVRARDYT